MSSFGAFGGGGSFGTFGPGDGGNSGFGDFAGLINPPTGEGSFGPPPPGYTYNPASGMNENFVPNNMSGVMAGSGITYSQAPRADPGQSQGMQQFQAAALQDYQNLVGANDMNYGNFMDAMGNYGTAIGTNADAIRAGGQEAFDFMSGEASRMSGLGADVAGGIKDAADTAVDDFKDLSAQQASSISMGLSAQNRSTHQQLSSQAKMGNPQAIAAQRQFELQSQAKTAQIMTEQASNYNNALAGLGMQRAGLYGQAGQVQAGFEGQAAALNQAGSAMQQSAIANAANYEAQGLSNYASMIAANPFSPVSFLPVLASYFQFGMTTGSESFPGLDEDLLGGMA